MLNLTITEDFVEMEKIGRQLAAQKPKVYTDSVKNAMFKQIDSRLKNLTREERESLLYRSIYDYWVYGALIYESLNFDFANKSHDQKSAYITKKNFLPYYFHMNDKDFARANLANKYNAYNFLHEYYKRDAVLIKDDTSYDAFTKFIDKHSEFVVKPVDFDSGRGIYKESVHNYKKPRDCFNHLIEYKNSLASSLSKMNFLQMEYNFDLLLEEIINQAEELANPHPKSLNLVRVTTVKNQGQVKILYASFKVGANGEFLNNPAVGSFSAMINSNTGIIETALFDENLHYKTPLEYHPDTGVKIRGFQIPRWNEAIALANELAKKLENVNYVGWDFALTPNGWCVVEGNDFGGVVMPQIAYSKGLKYELENLIHWKPSKQFWWEYEVQNNAEFYK